MEQPTHLETPETTLEPPLVPAAPRPQSPVKLLNRHFVLLWQGQAVSQLGSQVYIVALVLWITQATDSATLIGLLMMASSIPNVLLSGIAGTYADRHSRRRIIIYSDILRGMLILSLAALLYMWPQATELIIAWLFVVAVCMSVMGSFFVPAISAAIPDLVPQDDVAQANSLRQLTAQLSLFIGQGMGATLFRLLGAPLLVLVNALSFLISAASESLIDIPQQIPEKSATRKEAFEAFKQDIVQGFRYVWHKPGLRRLFFFSAIFNFFTMPIIVTLPFYVRDFLQVKIDWYGYLLAIYGVGILVGSLGAGFIKLGGTTRARVMITFAIFNSLIVGFLGFAPDLTAAIGLALLIGAMGAFNGVNMSTILQMSTASEIRGRVFGLLGTLTGSLAPLGMGLGSIVFDLTGQNFTLIYSGCAAIMVLLSILVSMSREFREFLAYEPAKRTVGAPVPHEAAAVAAEAKVSSPAQSWQKLSRPFHIIVPVIVLLLLSSVGILYVRSDQENGLNQVAPAEPDTLTTTAASTLKNLTTAAATPLAPTATATGTSTTTTVDGAGTVETGAESTPTAAEPTLTATITVSATPTRSEPTATATALPTETESPCLPAPPSGWVRYTIQANDALFPLAMATGTTVARIQEVNCLTGTILSINQIIWLPATPVPEATPTPEPSATALESPEPTSEPPTQPPPPPPTQPPPTATEPPTLTPPPP